VELDLKVTTTPMTDPDNKFRKKKGFVMYSFELPVETENGWIVFSTPFFGGTPDECERKKKVIEDFLKMNVEIYNGRKQKQGETPQQRG